MEESAPVSWCRDYVDSVCEMPQTPRARCHGSLLRGSAHDSTPRQQAGQLSCPPSAAQREDGGGVICRPALAVDLGGQPARTADPAHMRDLDASPAVRWSGDRVSRAPVNTACRPCIFLAAKRQPVGQPGTAGRQRATRARNRVRILRRPPRSRDERHVDTVKSVTARPRTLGHATCSAATASLGRRWTPSGDRW